MLGNVLAALGSLAVWVWNVDPPVMTLLAYAAAVPVIAWLISPREGWGSLWISETAAPTRGNHRPPPRGVEELLELRHVHLTVTAPAEPEAVPVERLADVIPLRPQRAA